MAINELITLGIIGLAAGIIGGMTGLGGGAIVIPALYLIFQPKTKCKVTLWLLIVGLIGGAFLNLNFWLASGYTSPSSDGLNLLMLVTQVVGVLCILDYNKKV